ncbi:MAG: hypothetical protein AAGC72_01070, partial [Planctomycetota bacterium]
TTASPIQGIGQGLQTCGLRWHVAENKVEFMQYDEDVPGRQLTLTANTVDTSKPYYLFAGLKGRAGTISGMRVRETKEYEAVTSRTRTRTRIRGRHYQAT